MLRRVSLILAFLLLPFLASIAQQPQYVEFKVRLTFQDGTMVTANNTGGQGTVATDTTTRSSAGGRSGMDSATAMQITLQMISDGGGGVVAEGRPDTEGVVTLRIVGAVVNGSQKEYVTYRIRVFGPEIEETFQDNVEPGRADKFMNISLRRKGEKPMPKDKGMVSANGLRIPHKAQKELEKGNKALAENKLDVAKEHINKAIELYPQFDEAYNMLGVVLLKSGDTMDGKKAFEKAVELNDKFARAYVNLAKLAIQDKEYEEAVMLIHKSLSVEPMSPEATSIACQAYLLTERYPDVVLSSRKLHALAHDGMTLCHFAAGVALTNLKQSSDAITEYNLFLSEARPNDILVPKARDAIEELNKQAAVQK
jgi:Tetratricopeptide repeat